MTVGFQIDTPLNDSTNHVRYPRAIEQNLNTFLGNSRGYAAVDLAAMGEDWHSMSCINRHRTPIKCISWRSAF
jgi:hypothetical protein